MLKVISRPSNNFTYPPQRSFRINLSQVLVHKSSGIEMALGHLINEAT